ncbi:hypothetical protein EV127DRAFT_473165 [Xylaria flabelliformis]|nr:hypothetical protein EV127DRAFT_473165 [Xylaria flabelliformis]
MDIPERVAWSTEEQTLRYKVYLGIWTNWSRGSVLGKTLTISRQQGDLLIAFTAFFVAFVGSRFWFIICLIFHRNYSTIQPRDTLHHQRQIILRNSGSPDSSLLKLAQLSWAWRRSPRSLIEILPTALTALLCVAAFTLAGGFSSQISSSVGNEVLLDGNNCGTLVSNGSSLPVELASYFAELFNNARNYVQQCYSTGSSGLIDCKAFVTERIPLFINDTAQCPFQNHVCRSNTSNLILDTGYLSSHDHFGINAPPNERMFIRRVLHCGALTTAGFTRRYEDRNGNYTLYDYGTSFKAFGNLTFTNQAKAIEDQYNFGRGEETNSDYLLQEYASWVFNGGYKHPATFIPREEIQRMDADTTLLFLSGNGVLFTAPVNDDWYRGTQRYGNTTVSGSPGVWQTYRPVEAASPLGCAEQYQFCVPDTTRCGPLGGFYDASAGAFEVLGIDREEVYDGNCKTTPKSLSNASGSRLTWFISMILNFAPNLGSVVSIVGSQVLASKQTLAFGLQQPLPVNQWHIDMQHTRAIILAYMQAMFVETAHGPIDPSLAKYRSAPINSPQEQVCRSQKIRSTEYASFNFFALLFTYVLGLVIIAVSFCLEEVLTLLQKHRNYKTYANLEWATNTTLQLHRLANEEMFGGLEWSHCVDAIPTTQAGACLASLNISDTKHPILAKRDSLRMTEKGSSNQSVQSTRSVTSTEQNRSMQPPAPIRKASLTGRVVAIQSIPSAQPPRLTQYRPLREHYLQRRRSF